MVTVQPGTTDAHLGLHLLDSNIGQPEQSLIIFSSHGKKGAEAYDVLNTA
jgi:hypothetical protein